ncbi:MAG: prolyl oligopeptidase family serine peptidase [Cyclobacteriaceae bacterium]
MNLIEMNPSSQTKNRLLAFLSFFLVCYSTTAQPSLWERKRQIKGTDTLQYRILVSDYGNDQNHPLVIFLHGSGERGSDNESQLKWGVNNFASNEVMKTYRPIVIAPQCPDNLNWSSNGDGNKSSQNRPIHLVISLIEDAIKTYDIDTSRIYITGLSMGGFGSFELLSMKPNLFAAAVPVCGGGDINEVPKFAHIPIWIFHGAKDAAVPVSYSTEMVGALMKEGATPGYTQYPEAGHFSWVAAYSDMMMMNWLFNQKK